MQSEQQNTEKDANMMAQYYNKRKVAKLYNDLRNANEVVFWTLLKFAPYDILKLLGCAAIVELLCFNGYTEQLETLAKQDEFKVLLKTKNFPLHNAIRNSHTKLVILLLTMVAEYDAKFDAKYADYVDKHFLLSTPIDFSNESILKPKKGAPLLTPLEIACRYDETEIATFLINKDARVNKQIEKHIAEWDNETLLKLVDGKIESYIQEGEKAKEQVCKMTETIALVRNELDTQHAITRIQKKELTMQQAIIAKQCEELKVLSEELEVLKAKSEARTNDIMIRISFLNESYARNPSKECQDALKTLYKELGTV